MTAHSSIRRFFGQADAHSVKSFHGNSPSTNPSSLKASSLKTRKSLNIVMPSLLGSKRGVQKGVPDTDSRMKREDAQVNIHAGGPPTGSEKTTEEMPIRPRKNSSEVKNYASQPNRPEGLKRSKSKAIMKMISTTFRTNTPPSEPGCVPAPASDLASKANREAALRERGLLPPLRPNKDLSSLEQEQDRHLPAIILADETIVAVEGDATSTTTAANLVKREWEAKNRPSDPDPSPSRMKSFKFGGLPSPAPSILEQAAPSTELYTVVESDDLSPSPTESQQVDEYVASFPEDRPNGSGNLSPRNKRTPPPLVFVRHTIVSSDYLLSPQSPATPYMNDPHLIPLPPSPLPSPQILPAASPTSLAGPEHAQISASSSPLPPPLDLPGTPKSLRSMPPVISLSPPPSASTDLSHNESLASTQPRFFSESESSDMTPSLDNSSQTMTVSSLSTSESLPNTGKAKINMSKVKVHGHNIPMIIESPIEETKDYIFSSDISHEPSAGKSDQQSSSGSPQVRPGQTLSFPSVEKSTNPVKRGHTLDPSTSVVAKNRLSMLSSMRRSVVGSLSRSKTAFITSENKKTFNASSHLSPSPPIPASFAEQARKFSPTRSSFASPRYNDVGSIPSVSRVAAAPIIYSRGSILNEMKNIKDEETRRVTELAFLG